MKHWLLIMLVLQPVAAFADDAGAREPAVVQAVAGPNAPEPEIPVSEPPELLKDGAEFDLGCPHQPSADARRRGGWPG